MRLRRDSKLEPGTFRDPVLVLVSNYATTVSMVLYSLRGVFWDPSCASFRCDESKSFLAPRWLMNPKVVLSGYCHTGARSSDGGVEPGWARGLGVQGRNRWWSSRYAAGSMELRYALMSMECPCRPLVGEGLLGVKYSLGGFRIRELWSWMFSLIDGRFLLIDGHVPLFFRQEKSLGLEDGARSQTRGQGTVTPEPGGRDLGPRGRNLDPGGRDLKDGSWSNRFMEYFSLTGSYADTPFTDNIALIEMPRKFSFPNINMYDGAGDPDNHIARYKQSMLAVALPREFREATMCKGFGSTLIGPALQWYINLPIGSISSFATLSNGFVEQFASSRNLEKTSDSLYEIL
ncbi:hypothetical protein F2Q70_00005127 [Brassica cretica]|uniref:Retrotransposon gag domain-containing protein n=1 Tax=Brassica cretica TaxID=69181 RepID=A0A8S9J665_BRACR|nr:hypothetical protein F2Q70_00005127 [Brassica cretica]